MKNLISRKNFFRIIGLSVFVTLIGSLNPLKLNSVKKVHKKISIKPNPLAVKRVKKV